MRVAILTLSDKGARGERQDTGGPALSAWLAEHGCTVVATAMLPDEHREIAAMLGSWADQDRADLILTTGGTGVSPRDITPEATAAVVERTIPGIGELMRLRSLEKTKTAMLSRAMAGIRAQSLIVNLPGSPKGAVECLEAVWQLIPHAVEKIRGDQRDCAGRF